MSEELKPCDHCECVKPFTPRVVPENNDPVRAYWVECPCGMKTAEYSHPSAAIRQWNTRHITKSDIDSYLSEHGMKAIRKIQEPATTMRDLTQEEGEGLYEALKRSTKEIKRPTTKADMDEYCKANGLVMVPEEPSDVMLTVGEEEIETSHEGEGAGSCYKAMVAAYKVQGI